MDWTTAFPNTSVTVPQQGDCLHVSFSFFFFPRRFSMTILCRSQLARCRLGARVDHWRLQQFSPPWDPAITTIPISRGCNPHLHLVMTRDCLPIKGELKSLPEISAFWQFCLYTTEYFLRDLNEIHIPRLSTLQAPIQCDIH